MDHVVGFVRKQAGKLLPDLKSYTRKKFLHDLGAGLTVGIIALPLSLALAIATGVPPIVGLYTAGVAGFLAALFSGSPYSVSGPAAAMVPILAVIVERFGMNQLPYITILAALFLAFFALIGIGKFINKVPESVVLGFTAGIATVIFFGQLNSFLGLSGLGHAEHFAGKLLETFTHLVTISLPTVIIGAIALAIILFAHRIPYIGKIPATLIAIMSVTLMTLFIPGLGDVATLGSVYGKLPVGAPIFNDFDFNVAHLADRSLWLPAFKIAALIAVETLLCAVVADKLTKTKHRSNQELAAQAFGNLGAAFFGGMPATAVIARTGTIIKNGAKTRVASVIHAIIVLAFIIALAPLASAIPLTALSAVLIVTAFKIAEIKEISKFLKEKSWMLGSVLALTMLLTIFEDLVVGVTAGLVLHLAFAAHDKLRGMRGKDGPIRLAEEEAE